MKKLINYLSTFSVLLLCSCSSGLGDWDTPDGFKVYRTKTSDFMHSPNSIPILGNEYSAHFRAVSGLKIVDCPPSPKGYSNDDTECVESVSKFYQIGIMKKLEEGVYDSENLNIAYDYLGEEAEKLKVADVVSLDKESQTVIFDIRGKIFKLRLRSEDQD